MFKFWQLVALSAALIVNVFGQRGDKPGEAQTLTNTFPVPPSPALDPSQALKSLKVAPGFRVELAASEPMIESPISLTFGPDGRMWVLEMRGFMPNVDGKGEDQPLGRVSVLTDKDGDGRMDEAKVFVDELVMPRALALVRDGLLVAEPPKLWFFKDTNGDGKADDKIEIASDYGTKGNPEHTSNGLMWGLDNWLYSANHTTRYRFLDGKWVQEATAFRGQWGLSMDNYGRIFHNSNADQLRADLVPAEYLARNPALRNPLGLNYQVVRDQAVWPARVNPGVNRGYQKGQLRQDGTLATVTAACAPCIYRGDQFPAEFVGAAFVCEPAGNLVRCNRLVETNGLISGANAFNHAEFLASTDERFRPVNAFNGPDGALYVVDMYRGVLQHRLYVTTYLRNQILSRGLENPVNRGRIYRVVHDGKPARRGSDLAAAAPAALVNELASNNGWRRDIAQRLLVEKRDPAVVPALEKLAADSTKPLGQIHALWALEGMDQLMPKAVLAALDSRDTKVQVHALRLAGASLQKPAVFQKVLSLSANASPELAWQLLFTLGESKDPEAPRTMAKILQKYPENAYLRDAAVSGLRGRELEFMKLAAAEAGGKPDLLVQRLAGCIAADAKPAQVDGLLAWAAENPKLAPDALEGLLSVTVPGGRGRRAVAPTRQIKLAAQPASWTALQNSAEPEIKKRWERVAPLLVWPGKEGVPTEAQVKPLTKEEQERFEAGKALYLVTCGACHQPHGMGQEGLAPPLLDSEWALGSPQRMARIVLQGVRGLIHVKGKTYSLDMPPLGILDDDQIASLLTYVRREWGHTASPVTPGFVARVREATAKREEAWNEADLLKIP